jgi:hypothetical protein
MQRMIFLFGLVLSLAMATGVSAENLVHNGSFEEGTGSWQFLSQGAQATGDLDCTVAHDGKCSFKITNKSGQQPNIYARIVQFVTGLKPFTTYKVSCWVKGQACGNDWIGGGLGWYQRTSFPKGDFDWTPVSFEIQTDANADNYELMVLTESQTKALWVDDIRFDAGATDAVKERTLRAQFNATVAGLEQRSAGLTNLGNAYVRLGKAVADRFLGFARQEGPGQMSQAWKNLQLQEVADVLNEAEKIQKTNSPLLNWTPPRIGKVKYKNGTFYNDGRPWYFYGYGHFDSVFEDLPNFPALGASLVQDGRAGPSAMSAEGVLGEGALTVLKGMDRAAQFHMRDDFLLSPHYYPAWAEAPDVPNGNIGFITFNIFHPKAKDAVGRWAAIMGEQIKNKPALHSVCLANEPVYNTSGRDAYTHPLFVDYLKQVHRHDLAAMNALYGTAYTNFDQAAVPPCFMPAETSAKRAFYDWSCFNKKMFADWHAWMDSVLKSHGVKAPTHTKIMVFQTMDRDKVGWGVDPELICHSTDLAGCDAYAFPGGAYAYDWTGHEFFYDLLHSFRGQSVFNSENHLIPDGSGLYHIPMDHSRSVIWQDGLHHEGSSTIWVWQMSAEQSGLGGSIYFRPANIFGAGRAMLDLNRLAPEVTAINDAKPRVALLDSQPSIFWEDKYKGAMISAYTILSFMGEPVTFVSERELAAGTATKVECVIVPEATHVFDKTLAALETYRQRGGKILLIGNDSLARDEYDRPSRAHPDYPKTSKGADDPGTAGEIRAFLQEPAFKELRQTKDGLYAWGVEYRVVPEKNSKLIPLVNFNNEARTVYFPNWPASAAVDLLSGGTVDLKSIHLDPMVPRLLRVSSN